MPRTGCFLVSRLIGIPPQLLDEPDWDVYYWCTEGKAPPERWADSPILEKLKIHARNEGKAVRRMPDLDPSQRSS